MIMQRKTLETVLQLEVLWGSTHRDDGADGVLSRKIFHPNLRGGHKSCFNGNRKRTDKLCSPSPQHTHTHLCDLLPRLVLDHLHVEDGAQSLKNSTL